MGEVRVKFSGAVFTHFFEVHKRMFGINKGLPEGAELVDIQFDPVMKGGEATFSHESFAPVPDGGDPPYIDVQLTAYEKIDDGYTPEDHLILVEKEEEEIKPEETKQ